MFDLIKSITKQEWKFWTKAVIAVLILTSLSRIFAILWTPDGYIWTGRTYFAPCDRYVYISYIEQIKNGANVLQDLYSAKGETAPMINLFWMSAGYIARFSHIPSFFLIEILRILSIPLLLFVLYIFFSFFVKNIIFKKIGFLLAVFGGGLGVWIYPLTEKFTRMTNSVVDYLPIDFSISEAFIFLSSYYSAHFIISTALMILIIVITLIALEKSILHYAIYAGALGLFLANFHPFSFVVPAYAIGAYFIFLLWKDKARAIFLLKYLVVFCFFILPAVLYHLKMMNTPWWQNQTWNSQTERPNFVFILFGYGLLIFFSFGAIYGILKKRIEVKNADFLIIWFFSQISLIFLPISVQRRFLDGYQVLLALLATLFISLIIKKRPWLTYGKIFPAIIFISLFFLSFLAVIYLDIYNFYGRIQSMYVSRDHLEALKELKNYTNPDDLIIADLYSSNMIPGVALRRVFVGHGIETINYKYKSNILTRFGVSADENERLSILKDNKIEYVFYDPHWNWAWNPDNDKNLERIYEKGEYKIYKVK